MRYIKRTLLKIWRFFLDALRPNIEWRHSDLVVMVVSYLIAICEIVLTPWENTDALRVQQMYWWSQSRVLLPEDARDCWYCTLGQAYGQCSTKQHNKRFTYACCKSVKGEEISWPQFCSWNSYHPASKGSCNPQWASCLYKCWLVPKIVKRYP